MCFNSNPKKINCIRSMQRRVPPRLGTPPYTISCSSNSKEDSTTPLLQKRRVNSDSNSLITNTTLDSTMDPVTLDTTSNTNFKEEVKI